MDDDNRFENKQYILGLITGLIISMCTCCIFFITWYVKTNGVINKLMATNSEISPSGTTFDDKEFQEKVEKINKYIDNDFLNEVDESDLVEGAYKGMVGALDDPYSSYYSADEYKKVIQSTNGTYKGIGVGVKKNDSTNEIVIVKIYDDSPALEAGLKENDIIKSIDGEDFTGSELTQAILTIRTTEKEKINVEIERDGQKKSFEVRITDIDANTVASGMYDDKIGYILLSGFEGVSTNQFAQAINKLKDEGMEKLIIDLRDNPGGRLDVVCDILDLFVDKDKMLVYTKDKYGNGSENYAKYKASIKDIPICVLVNGKSASAAEVFSGVMKDYKLATIVGEKTYGKGIVQQLINLGDGSALKLTVSKYYLPNDENIQGEGIEPDVEVGLPGNATTLSPGMEDTQFNKAIEILSEK